MGLFGIVTALMEKTLITVVRKLRGWARVTQDLAENDKSLVYS